MSAISDVKPFEIFGVRIAPPLPNANPRQVFDFGMILLLAKDRSLPEEIAVEIARAYQRLYMQIDSSAG